MDVSSTNDISSAIENKSESAFHLVDMKSTSVQTVSEAASAACPGNCPWTGDLKAHSLAHFKTATFRTGQLESMIAILSKRDVIVRMPTGYGKSRCYMLPAAISINGGVTIVISPMVSLIADQLKSAYDAAIPAGGYYSGMPSAQIQFYQNELSQGQLKLFYVTPEYVAKSETFRALLRHLYQSKRIRTFVFDEAHCLLEATCDFRPEYLAMQLCRDGFPDVPIMALSATITNSSLPELQAILKLRDPVQVSVSSDRRNLYYRFAARPKTATEFAQHLRDAVTSYLGIKEYSQFNVTGIVYASTVATVAALARVIQGVFGVPISQYHSKMSLEERDTAYARWMTGNSKIMVATSAFGLGVDHSGVRFVAAYDAPSCLNQYAQMMGRAGRDGDRALCIVYWAYKDKTTWQQVLCRSLARSGQPSMDDSQTRKLHGMLSVASSAGTCIRKALLEQYDPHGVVVSAPTAFDPSDCCFNCSTGSTRDTFTVNLLARTLLLQQYLASSTSIADAQKIGKRANVIAFLSCTGSHAGTQTAISKTESLTVEMAAHALCRIVASGAIVERCFLPKTPKADAKRSFFYIPGTAASALHVVWCKAKRSFEPGATAVVKSIKRSRKNACAPLATVAQNVCLKEWQQQVARHRISVTDLRAYASSLGLAPSGTKAAILHAFALNEVSVAYLLDSSI